MGKQNKLLEKLVTARKVFPWNELKGGALKSVKTHLKQEGWL